MTEAPQKGRHPIRENLDSLAIAVLMAVLMKYFAIEAYQIPTSSMQPTMMGSKASGVFDRILVDKSRYLITEPKHWDIAVFRYPLRKTQSYVKRIVGLPGNELRIAGGNVYKVRPNGDPMRAADLNPLRRPTTVQAHHWKELYPARAELHGENRALDYVFTGSSGAWTEEDGRLTVSQRSDRSRSTLTFVSRKDGGLVDRVYDGYPAWVSKAMITAGEDVYAQSVQDARVAFTILPDSAVSELRVSLKVNHTNGGSFDFALLAADGEGRLVVETGGKEAAASTPFPLPLASGSSTSIRFWHLDDQCVVEVDGTVEARLDCSAFRTLQPLIPQDNSDRGRVVLRVQVRGGDEVAFEDIVVERDLHYLPSSMPGEAGPPSFKVPQGHYFMLGDNTQQSVDSRDWTAISVGMTADGRLVDPKTDPNARVLRGNLRAIGISESPDPDENPVVVLEEKKIVFSDDIGEVWKLSGEIVMDPGSGRVYTGQTPWFSGGPEGAWMPEREKVHFVPREHIIGRPLMTFWPAWPWFRIGFIQ